VGGYRSSANRPDLAKPHPSSSHSRASGNLPIARDINCHCKIPACAGMTWWGEIL